MILSWIWTIIFYFGLLSITLYFVPLLIEYFLLKKEQNLAQRYNAKWAVVTGGSSGIGKAIVERLATQGINVFVVAYPDAVLDKSMEEFEQRFPSVEFRKIGVNLAQPENALSIIDKATEDKHVNLVFNNAGFIKICLFGDTDLAPQMANYHVNLTTPILITHLFAQRLLTTTTTTNEKEGRRGAFFFTSSPSGLMPNPFASIYGLTKAGMTSFASSLAAELKPDNIDVLVVHPSPTDTSFYTKDSTEKSDALAMFRKTATGPDTIAATFFRYIGKVVIHDQGYFPIVLKFILKLLPYNLFALVTSLFSSMSQEYKRLSALRTTKQE